MRLPRRRMYQPNQASIRPTYKTAIAAAGAQGGTEDVIPASIESRGSRTMLQMAISGITPKIAAVHPSHQSSRPHWRIAAPSYTATLRYVTDADYIVDLTYFDADGNYGAAKIKFSMTHTSLVAEPVQFSL